MTRKLIAGTGGKRPLLYIDSVRLLLDPQNPRLPNDIQGKEQGTIKDALKRYFFLEELAQSMSENGYFDEEPLVGIPEFLPRKFASKTYTELKGSQEYHDFLAAKDGRFTIVEGNRRLATIKLLIEGKFQSIQSLNSQVHEDFKKLPVIIYPQRREVIAYLGVRHIIGVKKWDAYAKARYVASMKDDHGLSLDEIQKTVGDTTNSARKTYICYKLIDIMEQEYEDYDSSMAKENFSFLSLATGQGSIKDYIGLPRKWSEVNPDEPIGKERVNKLKNLFIWLFGDGKRESKVIEESRDITSKLTTVLKDADATQYLLDHKNLIDAYDRSGGEKQLLNKYLKRSKMDLGRALSLIPNNYNDEAEQLIIECEKLIDSIKKILP